MAMVVDATLYVLVVLGMSAAVVVADEAWVDEAWIDEAWVDTA